MRYVVILVLILKPLSFCIFAQESDIVSNEKLAFCISDYRDGFYARAIQCIEKSLPELITPLDSVESFKILALSYGMINQIDKAKLYFSILLDKDTTAQIDTLAFPPNISLIYNQVKLEKKVSRIEKSSHQPQPQPIITYKKKRNAALPLLLSSVIVSTGGAVYLYYNGILARDEYSKLGNDQKKLDKKWDEFRYSIAGGVGCTVISGLTTWLFFRVLNKNSAASVTSNGNGISFVYDF